MTEKRPVLYLNRTPDDYIGIKKIPGRNNIGYISKNTNHRGGEICVYEAMKPELSAAKAKVDIVEGEKQHAGSQPHVGNIEMPEGNKTPEDAIKFLQQFFDLKEV